VLLECYRTRSGLKFDDVFENMALVLGSIRRKEGVVLVLDQLHHETGFTVLLVIYVAIVMDEWCEGK
jgi:hypothetical protein